MEKYKYTLPDLIKALSCSPVQLGKDLDPQVELVIMGVVKTLLDGSDIEPSDKNIQQIYAAFYALLSAGIRYGEIKRGDFTNLMLIYKENRNE